MADKRRAAEPPGHLGRPRDMKQSPWGARLSGRPRPATRILALCGGAAAIALVGCASAPARGPAPGTTALTVAASPVPTAGTPQQRAAADAALMLKAFAPPAGAREVATSPVPSSPLSTSQQAVAPMDNDVVTRTSWWLAPGAPQQVLAWEEAHIPPLYHRFGWGTTGTGIWSDDFSIPAVPGLFDQRDMAVSTTSAGKGEVAIRVDALVDWIPVRPAGDTIPAAARVATVVETKGAFGETSHGRPEPVLGKATVTDRTQVAAVAAYLNGLAVDAPDGVSSCPDPAASLTVTFRAGPGGPALAEASAGVAGCAFLSYTMPGQPAIGLGGGAAGDNLLTEVDRVMDLHWRYP